MHPYETVLRESTGEEVAERLLYETRKRMSALAGVVEESFEPGGHDAVKQRSLGTARFVRMAR